MKDFFTPRPGALVQPRMYMMRGGGGLLADVANVAVRCTQHLGMRVESGWQFEKPS